MDLISIIMIIVIITKIMKRAGNAASKVERYGAPKNVWDQVAGQTRSREYTSTQRRSSNQSDEWKKLIRENIEKTRKRAIETMRNMEHALEEEKPAGTYQMPKHNVRTTPVYEQINMQSYQEEQAVRDQMARTKQRILESRGQRENTSAMQQVHAGRMEARTTSILERAIKNVDEDKVDVTLESMEREHNHSERVSPASHHHPEDVIPENMLGTIEDLMIKGYDGSLCFERDFVGEAMDMISRFTVPTDIPDFSKHDVA